MLENVSMLFRHVQASHTHTQRALTSLDEKVRVCERPDRLGSATNPDMSELGLPGLESSMTDKLWNKWETRNALKV